MRGSTYERVRQYADERGVTASSVVNAALRDLARPVRPLEQRRAPTGEQVAEAIALSALRRRKGWQTTAALGVCSISRQRLDAALASLARGGLVARCETALGPMWRARAAGVRAPMPGLGVSSCAESAR